MKHATATALLCILGLLTAARAELQLDAGQLARLAGASVFAQDEAGTFLGRLAPADEADSIFKLDGDYGGTSHAHSVWNAQGAFGGVANPFSPHNPTASRPPRIVRDGALVGFLSANSALYGALEPFELRKIQHQIKPSPDGC